MIKSNKKYIQIHISEVKPGDIIFINGLEKTVCKNDITEDKFMGRRIFGNTYNLGTKPVIKVIYE